MAIGHPLRPALPGGALTQVQAKLGYQFSDRALISRALTHASAAAVGDRANERLEFLGDRVLGLLVAEALVERFPAETEGQLAKRHAQLVSRDALARVAGSLDLWPFLVLARGEKLQPNSPSIMADALEAVIAALYLDGGLDTAKRFVRAHWDPLIAEAGTAPRDPKTALQEWALARGLPLPSYRVLRSDGPAHRPAFEIAVEIVGRSERAVAVAGAKREAEKRAAAALLAQLEG